ncbi:hypothetical protein BC936DRAFT_143651 [Jimgerdemannia flammicorona]|uniref:GDSL-like Lipase/Acylhydrolase-domain-containing protein n=1 Tax=Jimgerdemannia flammicorona TaxID=994334 RepID=A0A433DDK5_9FUNG|nr:hypothetical protein BC936DRAFT_143651 [Jimgerdemannia flammicorona]
MRLPTPALLPVLFATFSLLPDLTFALDVKSLVVFGDSYSDTGNVKRKTNGPIWVEDLAHAWDAQLYGFAFAGATCDNSVVKLADRPAVRDQLSIYYKQNLKLDPDETVYAVWIGINDIGVSAGGSCADNYGDVGRKGRGVVRQIYAWAERARCSKGRKKNGDYRHPNRFYTVDLPRFYTLLTSFIVPIPLVHSTPLPDITKFNTTKATLAAVFDCVKKQITTLHTIFHAKHILLPNLPPPDLSPLFAGQADRKNFIIEYNALIDSEIPVFVEAVGGSLDVAVVDIHTLFSEIVDDPAMYGFEDVKNAYWQVCTGTCSKPIDEFLWWDVFHVTGGGHRAIANAVIKQSPFNVTGSPITNSTAVKVRSPKYPPSFATEELLPVAILEPLGDDVEPVNHTEPETKVPTETKKPVVEHPVGKVPAEGDTNKTTDEDMQTTDEDMRTTQLSGIMASLMVASIACIGLFAYFYNKRRSGFGGGKRKFVAVPMNDIENGRA